MVSVACARELLLTGWLSVCLHLEAYLVVPRSLDVSASVWICEAVGLHGSLCSRVFA